MEVLEPPLMNAFQWHDRSPNILIVSKYLQYLLHIVAGEILFFKVGGDAEGPDSEAKIGGRAFPKIPARRRTVNRKCEKL